MTDLHTLRARRAEKLANLEDLAEFKESKFPHERYLWKLASKAHELADEDYRRAAKEVAHEQ